MRTIRGFTLIEMIIAIVITGIIAGMVAVFIVKPVQGYLDTVRRAELTDMADLALKRMALEIRTAVPNTVMVHTDPSYVQFIPATGGGRYCTDADTCPTSPPLTDFSPTPTTSHSTTFDVLGPPPTVNPGDKIIIYNTGQSPEMNAYSNTNNNCGGNLTPTGTPSTLTYDSTTFPYASPSNRFQVAPSSGPVQFNCTANQVQRVNGAVPFCGTTPTPSTPSVLAAADSVSCNFTYDAAVSGTNGLLTMSLTLTKSGESVTLVNQIHVDNTP